ELRLRRALHPPGLRLSAGGAGPGGDPRRRAEVLPDVPADHDDGIPGDDAGGGAAGEPAGASRPGADEDLRGRRERRAEPLPSVSTLARAEVRPSARASGAADGPLDPLFAGA